MKSSKFVSSLLIILGVIFVFNSCQKDSLGDDPRDNLVGDWKCQETGTTTSSQTFKVTISKASGDSTKLYIDNFYGSKLQIYVRMNSFSLVIPKQTVDNYVISGSGNVSTDYKKITWSYTVNDGGEVDAVSSTYTPYQAKSILLDSSLLIYK